MLREALKRVAVPSSKAAEAGRSSTGGGVVGFALGAGLVLGVGMFGLLDGLDRRAAFLSGRLVAGCTVLALDRNNGRTQAAPCPELALQLTAALTTPPPVPAVY